MNEKQYSTLSAYYGAAKSLKDQIKSLEGLIRGIVERAKRQGGAGLLNVSVSRDRDGGHGLDAGWWGKIPVYQFRDAILPVLHKALAELRDDYKALPPVSTHTVVHLAPASGRVGGG